MIHHKFGITHAMPTKRETEKMDDICREEGGDGFTECNRTPGSARTVNGGQYEGWFTSNDRGADANAEFRRRVLYRVKKELGITIY